MFNLLDYRRLPYFMCIEGLDLGNGKTLLSTIMAHEYRLNAKIKILSNIDFKHMKYDKIVSEEQLFSATNCLIIIDEFDLYSWAEHKLDGEKYYIHLIKNARKKRIKVIVITQQLHLIQAKVRRMLKLICFPHITNQLDYEQEIEYNGKKYLTTISTKSKLEFQWYIYREINNRSKLAPFGKRCKIGNLYYWFNKYDTYQILDKIEKLEENKNE